MNVRGATTDDFPALLELVREEEEVLTGRPTRLEDADLRGWLTDVDLAHDTWVYDDGGRIVGFAWVELHADLGVAVGIVRPDAKGKGLGSRIVETYERRLRERGAPRLHAVTLADDPAAPALLESHGYREVRRFYEMAIELTAEPVVPELPDGLALEQVQDMRTMYDAMDEAFQDHWEHRARPFDEWLERRTTMPGYDPSLWFWIRDGDEVAAGAENYPNRNGGGFVGALGTRRPWRGRGLARTLLLHTFAEFHRRGITRVTLGVDAENPTGATALYESVGMAPELVQVVHEKALA